MGRYIDRRVVLTVFCLGCVGCASAPDARYVYQDGEYGVIGIPRNSMLGKKDFREQAYHLMALHFPEGYEIVRAEEVVEGERVFEAARKLEVDSEPGVTALNQALKIGKFAKSTAIDQKDTVHITESRIIYRRKHDGVATGRDGFASVATVSPELYIDPNQVIRKVETTQLVKKEVEKKEIDTKVSEKKLVETKEKDENVMKASILDPK